MERFTRRLLSEMFNFIMAATILATMTAINANAELKSLSDLELSAVYAEGFSNFTITDLTGNLTETKAWFNIEAYTYTEIDSLKLGYHDDIYNPVGTKQWDQNWINVQLGADYEDPTDDLHASGFYFKAVFENIDTPSSRELKSITFGVDDLIGPIAADFKSFSGTIDDNDNPGDGFPFYGHALALNNRTITADDFNGDGDACEFSITLSVDPSQQGYWVNFSEAEVTPP